jgi:hypothetical protein
MEVEFLNRELAANEIEAPAFAINDDEGSLPLRRTTFEESRNVDHQVRYRKLFSVARFTLGVISQVLVYTTATYL